MDNNQCSATTECKKPGIKCFLTVLAVFVVMMGFNWLYHGVYMMPDYQATASNWRSLEEMQQLGWICIVTKLVMAAVVTCLFCCVAKGCETGGKCYKKGACFGLKIGLLLGAQQFSAVISLPIPMGMAVKWLIGNLILGLLVGLLLTALTRCCKKPVA